MPMFQLTVQHGKTQDEARLHLEQVVNEVRSKFGPMIQKVEWSADRNTVNVSASGVQMEMRVDPREIHVAGDVLSLGGLLGSPLLLGVRGIFQRHFPKMLSSGPK